MFGRVQLKSLISEAINTAGVDLWLYDLNEIKKLKESATKWPTGQLEDGKDRLTEEEEYADYDDDSDDFDALDASPEDDTIDETSSMAGGSVAGAPGGAWGPEEKTLRESIRLMIFETLDEKVNSHMLVEEKLRKIIKGVLNEKSTVTANPHHMTGINSLETLLQNIVPTIEADFKVLTTSNEQRDSYMLQLKHSMKSILDKVQTNRLAGTDQDGDGDLDETMTEPDQGLRVVDEQNPFIDIDGDGKPDREEKDVKDKESKMSEPEQVQGIDPTGRAQALKTISKIGKQTEASFAELDDPRDIGAFSKYLLVNTQLYGDKFEKEVSGQLADLDAQPAPDDAVDTEDGLAPDEMEPGMGGEEDPGIPDDLEDDAGGLQEEWEDAQKTTVEFYSTPGASNPVVEPRKRR